MFRAIRYYLILLLLIIFIRPLLSQQTVIAEGRSVLENITREQAKYRAMQQARKNGLNQALGISVQAETFVKDAMFAGEFVHSISYGHIIEEEILDQKMDVWQKSAEQDPIPVYYVKLKMKIIAEKGEPDPAFKVDAELNKNAFTTGEEMVVDLRVTQDCYVIVLNIAANDDIYVLFPNKYQPDNLIIAGQTRQIPSKRERSFGLHYRLSTLPGHSRDTEYIKIIATKKPIAFLEEVEEKDGVKVFKNDKMALTELAQWLSTIPMNERAEDLETYIVVKK